MPFKHKQKAGFSLIELMLGSTAMTILMLIVGLIAIFGWRAYSRGRAIVDMQQDASLAHTAIAKEVRQSRVSDIVAGSSLICVNTNGTTQFLQSGNDLIASGSREMVLVNGSVTGFSTLITNETVIVNMTLDAGGLQREKTYTITPRN